MGRLRCATVGSSDHAKHIIENFLHVAQNNNILRLDLIKGVDSVADLLTKPLLKHPFVTLCKLAGVKLGHPRRHHRGACEDLRAHALLCGRARPTSAGREAILFICCCEGAAILWI